MEKDGKHNIPHIHAYSGEDSLVVDFAGNIIEGQLERKKQAMVVAWVMMHEDELRANYEIMLEGEQPFRIAPLK